MGGVVLAIDGIGVGGLDQQQFLDVAGPEEAVAGEAAGRFSELHLRREDAGRRRQHDPAGKALGQREEQAALSPAAHDRDELGRVKEAERVGQSHARLCRAHAARGIRRPPSRRSRRRT